jgi:type IV pilus assembly protein PilV
MKSRSKIQKLSQSKLKVQQGIVILEALIAILIFSMGILALVGLQAAMIANTSENKYRADASFIALQSMGLGWTSTANAAGTANLAGIACGSGQPCSDVSNILPRGTRTVAIGNRGLVTVTVSWQAPGGRPHNYTAQTYIGAF